MRQNDQSNSLICQQQAVKLAKKHLPEREFVKVESEFVKVKSEATTKRVKRVLTEKRNLSSSQSTREVKLPLIKRKK
jgi:hypothetical protein